MAVAEAINLTAVALTKAVVIITKVLPLEVEEGMLNPTDRTPLLLHKQRVRLRSSSLLLLIPFTLHLTTT